MLDVYKYWFYDLGNLWSNVNIMSCWASVTFRFPPTDRVTPVSQCLCNGETQSRDINLSAWSLQEITHFTDLIDSQISKMVLHTQTPLSFAAGIFVVDVLFFLQPGTSPEVGNRYWRIVLFVETIAGWGLPTVRTNLINFYALVPLTTATTTWWWSTESSLAFALERFCLICSLINTALSVDMATLDN